MCEPVCVAEVGQCSVSSLTQIKVNLCVCVCVCVCVCEFKNDITYC